MFIPVHPVTSTQYRKVTPSALVAVNRKLAGAATTANHKRQVEPVEDGDLRPSKKKKPVVAAVRTSITKVTMSANARQILSGSSAADGRRSSRPRVPSLKLRENEPAAPKTRVSPRRYPPSISSLSAVPDSPDPLPALPVSPTTPTSTTPVSPKSATPKSLAVAAQPRDANGRFGKKAATNGRFIRKTLRKHYTLGHKMLPRPTAIKTIITLENDDQDDDQDADDDDQYSDPFTEVEFGEEALEDVVLKRTSDSDQDESPRKRIRISESDASDTSPTTSPRFTMGRGSLLRPNPIAFARRKWAVEEEHSSFPSASKTQSYTDSGVKIERVSSLAPAAIITSKHSEPQEADPPIGSDTSPILSGTPSRPLAPAARMARLTFRPSPMNLARRRWAPTSTSDETTTRHSSLLQESTTAELAHAYSDGNMLPTRSARAVGSSSESLGGLVYPECESDSYASSDEVCSVSAAHILESC